jgi:hypothetical protein
MKQTGAPLPQQINPDYNPKSQTKAGKKKTGGK